MLGPLTAPKQSLGPLQTSSRGREAVTCGGSFTSGVTGVVLPE